MERRGRVRGAMAAVALLALLAALAGCRGEGRPEPAAGVAGTGAEPSFEEHFGIRLESTRLSAGGAMVDVRYRVTDPERARAFQDRRVHPRLLSEATGRSLDVPRFPKTGALRQTPRNAEAGRVYFLMFRNPAGAVRRGERVDIVMGTHRSEGHEVL